MYLIIKHKSQPEKELRFRNGPIYIGRQLGSQIFLADKTVSRQHAVIYSTKDGQWILEDLDSANKTYLNGKAIHKSKISDGDTFQISDFIIEVKFRATSSEPAPINMDDTLLNINQEMRMINRKFDETNGSAFRLSPDGMKFYAESVCNLCKAANKEELLDAIIETIKKQLFAYHIWIGFTEPEQESFYLHGGKTSAGQRVLLDTIILKPQILTAMEKLEFKLIPRISVSDKSQDKTRSALIAPIILERKCFGVIYIDNSLNHEQYDIMDLNYLMLLSVNIANLLQKL